MKQYKKLIKACKITDLDYNEGAGEQYPEKKTIAKLINDNSMQIGERIPLVITPIESNFLFDGSPFLKYLMLIINITEKNITNKYKHKSPNIFPPKNTSFCITAIILSITLRRIGKSKIAFFIQFAVFIINFVNPAYIDRPY